MTGVLFFKMRVHDVIVSTFQADVDCKAGSRCSRGSSSVVRRTKYREINPVLSDENFRNAIRKFSSERTDVVVVIAWCTVQTRINPDTMKGGLWKGNSRARTLYS